MKPINEIRIRLCAIFCIILLPLFSDYYPHGSGWTGMHNVILVCILGLVLGCFVTNLMEAIKKWWKQ